MLNSARQKKKKFLTLMLSGKIFLNETKNHNPPFKLNGWPLKNVVTQDLLYSR